MNIKSWSQAGILALGFCLSACGKEEPKPTLQEKFEAIYGYTDCQEVIIGTALTQPVWVISFQTYYGGYLDQKETYFWDEKCKKTYTYLNRWATYRILDSSNEATGEIHLEMKTRRILQGTADFAPAELPGIPDISCNIEMADDFKKDACKTYFSYEGKVNRYVTVRLHDNGLQPFLDLDHAGTSEETRSTELAPFILNMMDPIKK